MNTKEVFGLPNSDLVPGVYEGKCLYPSHDGLCEVHPIHYAFLLILIILEFHFI